MKPNVAPLLAFIRSLEASAAGYDSIWGGIRKADYPPKQLTQMTVQEVLDWQDKIDPKYRSEAAGAYQVMEDTLRGLVTAGKVSSRAIYNAKTQDAIAVQLMEARGLGRYMSGAISGEEFANNLAKEWASLPQVSGRNKGKGYYDGDGINKALTTADAFLRIVIAMRDAPEAPKASLMQSTTLAASGGQAATAVAAGAAALSGLSGTAQIVAVSFCGLIIVLALWIARERIHKWARGIR